MKKRIVVCCECGCLYDLHYIDNVRIRKKEVFKFECKNCGMVDVVYKNLDDFQKEEVEKGGEPRTII